jgi:hypothetical protein
MIVTAILSGLDSRQHLFVGMFFVDLCGFVLVLHQSVALLICLMVPNVHLPSNIMGLWYSFKQIRNLVLHLSIHLSFTSLPPSQLFVGMFFVDLCGFVLVLHQSVALLICLMVYKEHTYMK